MYKREDSTYIFLKRKYYVLDILFLFMYLFIYLFYLTLTFFLCFHILLILLLQTVNIPEIYNISS